MSCCIFVFTWTTLSALFKQMLLVTLSTFDLSQIHIYYTYIFNHKWSLSNFEWCCPTYFCLCGLFAYAARPLMINLAFSQWSRLSELDAVKFLTDNTLGYFFSPNSKKKKIDYCMFSHEYLSLWRTKKTKVPPAANRWKWRKIKSEIQMGISAVIRGYLHLHMRLVLQQLLQLWDVKIGKSLTGLLHSLLKGSCLPSYAFIFQLFFYNLHMHM